ncbi:MAG: hypothetical protein FWC55_03440 [Firmicutes bacterium]|nr:hypothetical protein [Bacillota bacterium]
MVNQYPYGRFSDDGKEFIINDPATPRAFDNFLWNGAVFSNVGQTGVGCFDYQVGENEAIQLLTGNGRVCDFDVYGRESLMSRLIYVRDNESGEFWNVNWEPRRKAYESYSCAHGLGYTVITNLTDGIEAVLTIFVPDGNDPVELWKVEFVNRSGRRRDLSAFAYCQMQFRYKWGFDSYGDMLYRSGGFDAANNAVVAVKHPYVKPHDYLTGFLTSDVRIDRFDSTRDAFVGQYGNLAAPDAVVRGKLSGTPGSSDATICAAQYDFSLEAGGSKTIRLILGAADGAGGIAAARARYLGRFTECLEELKAAKDRLFSANHVRTPDAHFDRMFNYWMKEQSAFGAAWCRWGWMGYRDIAQHGYGACLFEPERTKKILLTAVRYQYQEGPALRGWNPVDAKPYSDSALWLVFTLTAYVKETGDKELLDAEAPFYDGGADSVLGHAERALAFLGNHRGAHGLCLIKFGDWNDSLTAVGVKGKGESVWLSQAYAEALNRMAGLYAYIGDKGKANTAARLADDMKQALIKNAWDGNWFLRCFDDDGGRIGSAANAEGRIFCEPQAWALISGVPEEYAEKIIVSCDEMLLTDQGYRLLAPTFTRIDPRIGRISALEPGICENGTIYTHVNIWLILGLLRNGRADKAYEVFKALSPGYPGGKKGGCPPYVYANCYYGPDHRNNAYQMEFTWITGSIAWLNQVLACDMLGVEADYDGLRIRPNLPSGWGEITYRRAYRGAFYDIRVRNCGSAARYSVTADGAEVTDGLVPAYGDGKTHIVEAVR